jgi:hypothetical protein
VDAAATGCDLVTREEDDRARVACSTQNAGQLLLPDPPGRRELVAVELLWRTFAIDLETCASCGGRTKVIALVRDPAGITRFLRHLGEPTERRRCLRRAHRLATRAGFCAAGPAIRARLFDR